MQTISRSERRALYILILIIITLTSGIVTAGYLYYQNYKENYRFEVERQLSSIGKLKADELANWRQEHLGNADIFYKNAVFSALVRRYFEKPDDTDAQGQIRIWLSRIQTADKYDKAMLLDTQYSKKIIVPDGPERITSFVSQSASEILRSGKVAFEDFYWNEQNQRIYLKILVPILDEANDNRPIGILALRIDPEKYLYPLINHWPTPSRTAETLLIRREGDEVLYLNELRFQKNTALNLRFPLDEKKELPAVKAAMGQEGIVEGTDYRGVPVIADVRAVPDSPWFLVTQMDTSEVYAPLKEKLWETITLVGILLTVASVGVGFIWKQQIARFYRQKYEAEEALRESEERYKNLFKANIDGILIADVTTKKFRYANPAICRMLGYSEEELMRMGAADIHPKESIEQMSAEFKAQASGDKINAELPCVRKDGQIISVSINASMVTIGQTEYLMGIFRDITERKKIEKAQRQLVAIIEATPDFVGFADAKDKHIIYVNKAGRKMCGIGNDEDVTKLKIPDVHPEWTNKMFAEEILPAVVRDGVWTGECAFLNIRDRHEIPVLMVLSSHKASNGEVEAFSTISRDITERKQAEEMLRQAKKQAEAANEAKSLFLANMSHEIRTPMNAIIGFTELLTDEQLSGEQKEKLNIIKYSGQHLLSLINDILDFSKIEAGKLDTEIITCSLGQLLNSIESMMRPKAKEKGIEFEVIENNGLPAQISTDPTRLRQCLVNLTGNAIKFTEQGYVYIKVSLETADNKSNIRFDVEDTGIGVPEDRQDAIFESFTQADGSTARKYGGTGLGLTITKQLAELLGGKLTLTSEAGKGSVFGLVIPAGLDVTKQPFLDRHNIAGYREGESDKAGKIKFSGKVLVAEDVKTNQMLMKSLLEKMGIEVTIAEDGNRAMQKALAYKFDLILMDIQMPQVDGYEATKTLRAGGMTTPIIALTASAMKGDDVKCTKAGCNGYLTKPIDRYKLTEILGRYLTSENETLQSENAAKHQTAQSPDLADEQDDEEIIAWDRLIARGFDEQLIEKIMPTCIENNREHLEELTSAVKKADARDVELCAHAIKGSAGNMGAARLSEIAARLELMASEQDLSDADELLQNITIEFKKLQAFVSNPDWIEIAKREKTVTAEKFNDNVIS